MWIFSQNAHSHKAISLPQKSQNVYAYVTNLSSLTHYDFNIFSFLGRQEFDYVSYNNKGFIFYQGICQKDQKDIEPQEFLNEFIYANTAEKKSLYRTLSGHFTCVIFDGTDIYFLTDPLGVGHFFYMPEHHIFSSSLLATAYCSQNTKFYNQGCFEYVFSGAPHGSYTIFKNISKLYGFHRFKDNRLICLDAGLSPQDLVTTYNNMYDVQYHTKILETSFHAMVTGKRKPLLLISGGFDSRLLLALLLQGGYAFDLQYFDQGNAQETAIVHQLAEYTGQKLDYINKNATDDICLHADPIKNLWIYDGNNLEAGVFSNGQDTLNRITRSEGHLLLNGSLGEIYRNFFYFPDKEATSLTIANRFYAQYNPHYGGQQFDHNQYHQTIARNIADIFNKTSTDFLTRPEIEMIYPLYRGRHWTAVDLKNNLQFGQAVYPFMLPEVIQPTSYIPINQKNMGILEGQMIAHICPALAKLPTAYGYVFNQKRPLTAWFKEYFSQSKPSRLSQFIWCVKNHKRQELPVFLKNDYLKNYMSLSCQYTSHLFQHKNIKNHKIYNLVMTLELIREALG